LKGLPSQIGDWASQEVPLDAAISSKVGAEALVNRQYSRGNGFESVSLFIAASRVKRDTPVGHPPELCNMGAGWTFVNQSSRELPLSNGAKLPCTIFEFSQSKGLEGQRRAILCYYVADGQYWGSRLTLHSNIRRRSGPVDYVAQVQIAAATEMPAADAAMRLVRSFAIDSASDIIRLFENLEENRNSDQRAETHPGS
jgi:hypothetical protein